MTGLQTMNLVQDYILNFIIGEVGDEHHLMCFSIVKQPIIYMIVEDVADKIQRMFHVRDLITLQNMNITS